jgi:Sulfotransferase domain
MFPFGRRPIERLDFIVAGAQKSGTTALNYYLKRHPRIALPIKKELHFFDNDELFVNSVSVSYEPLHKMFRPARADSVAGENTPNYLYCPPALPRIHAYNPAIKLILLLRNPIDRAFSQWNMQRVRGLEPLDFLDAVRAEPERLAKLPPEKSRKVAYVDRGRYGTHLERVFSLFPRDQLLILKYEDFRARQRELVGEVYRFLQLQPIPFRTIEAHDIPYQRKLHQNERDFVFEMLRIDMAQVEELLCWDCSDWH